MYNALEKSVAASHQTHIKEILKKQDALVQYKRMQYVNAGKQLSKEDDDKLVEDVKKTFISQMPKIDIELLSHLDKETHHPVEAEHIENIATFLDSQRVYVELLERYNPGISMKQTDKVRKTARRVGLEVPE
jgi:ATP synthase assembly factor FMC1